MSVEEHREQAEKAIQKILIDLWNDTGLDIDVVQVDTRNFANYRTEIFFEGDTP
jgi:hypothetical protein